MSCGSGRAVLRALCSPETTCRVSEPPGPFRRRAAFCADQLGDDAPAEVCPQQLEGKAPANWRSATTGPSGVPGRQKAGGRLCQRAFAATIGSLREIALRTHSGVRRPCDQAFGAGSSFANCMCSQGKWQLRKLRSRCCSLSLHLPSAVPSPLQTGSLVEQLFMTFLILVTQPCRHHM